MRQQEPLQDPAAAHGTGIGPDPTMVTQHQPMVQPNQPGSAKQTDYTRTEAWFNTRYLPVAEQDDYIIDLSRAALLGVREGQNLDEFLRDYKPEDQQKTRKHLAQFEATFQSVKAEPLRSASILGETYEDDRLIKVASDSDGLKILNDLAEQSGDTETAARAQDALNLRNIAMVGQVMRPGKALDESVTNMVAVAHAGVQWGGDILQGHEEAVRRYSMSAPGAGAAASIGWKIAQDNEFQAMAWQFSQSVAAMAELEGLDYKVADKVPATAEEAMRLFHEAIPTTEKLQGAIIGLQSVDVAFHGPEYARYAMAAYAKALYASRTAMRDNDGLQAVADIEEILSAYAQGRASGNPNVKAALAAAYPAFWVLDKIISPPDRAVSALLFGSVGRTAPVQYKFADGSVFTDTLSATEHAMKIKKAGGEYLSPQWLIDESAESRLSALEDEALAAEFQLRPGEKDAGFFSTVGRSMVSGFALMQEGLRRAGDAVEDLGVKTGALSPKASALIPDEKAARPVVLYELTTMPKGGIDLAHLKSSVFDGSAEFIGQAIRNRISVAADEDWGYRTISWVATEVPTVALSPWNTVHTNQITRGAVDEARAKAFGDIIEPAVSKKQPVTYYFNDGKQMNAEWSAVREKAAEALGAGKAGDFGGSGDIVDFLLTTIRDNPGKSYDEIIEALKNNNRFLEQATDAAVHSGMAPKVRAAAAGMSQAEVRAAQRLNTAKLLDEAFVNLAPAIRGAPLAFGTKNFWTSQTSRNAVMQARRGIYMGPVGVPVGPITSRILQASSTVGKALKRNDAPGQEIMSGVSALGRATSAMFGFSHVASGTPVPGMSVAGHNVLPETVRIPFRMKKIYERQYRQQAATLEARAQSTTEALFLNEATGELLPQAERRMLPFVVEGGKSIVKQTNYLIKNMDVINDYGRRADGKEWIKGATEQERRASAMELATRLNPWTTKIQNENHAIHQAMTALGIVDADDEVKNYMLHFFEGPAGDKSMKWAEEAAAKLGRTSAGSPAIASAVDRGTSAIDRVGPVNLVEALRLGYYAPELDAMLLMHHRITQAAEVELKAYFSSKIAATFGVPMMRGKEAAVQLIQGVRGSQRWRSEGAYSRGILSREAYLSDLKNVSKLIRNRGAEQNRAALADIALELGIPMSKFLDDATLTKSMLESDSFLHRAATGGKQDVLSRIMPAKAREALRGTAREMLAHKTRMRALSLDLADLGVEILPLKNLTDEELAAVSRQAAIGRLGPIQSAQKRLREAEAAHAVAEQEAKELAQGMANQRRLLVENIAKRNEIAAAWDAARAAAERLGLKGDDLAQAKSVDKVRGYSSYVDWLPPDVLKRQKEAFDAYKMRQAEYVANAQMHKSIKGNIKLLKGEQNASASTLNKSARRIDHNKKALAAHQKHNRTMRTAAGARAADLRGEMNEVADAFLQSVRDYTETRRTMETLMASSTVRGAAKALQKSAHAVAAHGQAVRSAVAAFEMRHGISAVNSRQRILAAPNIKAMKAALDRKLVRDASAQKPLAGDTSIKAVSRGPDKNGRPDVYAVGPVAHRREHDFAIPVSNHAEFHEYRRAQEGLDALEISREEQSAMLWAVFGARQITEVPLHELRELVNSSQGMRAKVIRFLEDPYHGRRVSRTMPIEPGTAGHRIARALGVDTTGVAESVVERVEKTLDEYIFRASAGSERHQHILDAIPVADLASIYRYDDMTAAAMKAIREDSNIRKWVGTMTDRSRGSLERVLRTTFIPLEIGLAMKTLMGERVLTHSEAMKISLATRFGDALASAIRPSLMPLSRGFKAQAIAYRASMLPGRRNSLFDGVRSMIQLASWSFFSPSARRSFLDDISNRTGTMQTATGSVDRATFHAVFESRGSSMMGAQADNLEAISRNMDMANKKAKKKRVIREIREVGKEARRTTGVNIPKGGLAAAGVGGLLAEALFDDLLSGVAVGFGLYGFASGAFGLRRTVHSSGRIATKAEWAAPIGPHAIERTDNTFRYFQYWTYVKSGMAPMDAMDMMLPRMRDWSNLTDAERRIVQNVALLTPYMFYNFTKQNGIAQVVRWLDRPDLTAQMIRTVASMSDDENLDPDARAFWQSVTDSIKVGGNVWNMQDEQTAFLNMLSPVIGFLEGLGDDLAMSGLLQGVNKMRSSGDPSPAWKIITSGFQDEALPAPLAAKILEQYGAFTAPGVKAYWNEEGVPIVEIKGLLSGMAALSGATMGLNDIGRLHTHYEMDQRVFAYAEAMGLGRIYQKQLQGEIDMQRMNRAEQMAVQISPLLESRNISHDTAMDMANLDFHDKAVIEEMLKFENGKFVARKIAEFRKKITVLRNKAKTPVAGKTPQYQQQ